MGRMKVEEVAEQMLFNEGERKPASEVNFTLTKQHIVTRPAR